MMSQNEVLKFLTMSGVAVTHTTYNFLNDLIAIANKTAEEDFKKYLLTLCEANGLMDKGGAE